MEQATNLPKWNDPTLKAGTMIRTALWLISEVGVGHSFTKEKHRAAFAGKAQADRRMRDLRKYGWVIHTSAEDATLNSDEQRLVQIGRPVWDREARRTAAPEQLTAKARRATFAENDYMCVVCGIAGGERYPDAPHMTAVLAISRRSVTLPDGSLHTMFVSECKRCRSGAAGGQLDLRQLLQSIRSISPPERAVFARWAESGRRSPLDSLWADFRQLPSAARAQVRERLKQEHLAG